MNLHHNGRHEQDLDCPRAERGEQNMMMNFFEFEEACYALHDRKSEERTAYCVHSYDEMHKHNLALASQCVLCRLPVQIVYNAYCCVDAQIRAHEKNEYTLTESLELLGYMYSQYSSLIREAVPMEPAYSEIVERTFSMLDDAFKQEPVPKDLSVQQIAKRLNVTPNYLSGRFAKETGVTLTGYVTRRRLRRASFLLLNTTLSVAEIAERVGFGDSSYYSTVCRRFTGLSPTQYRDRQKTLHTDGDGRHEEEERDGKPQSKDSPA